MSKTLKKRKHWLSKVQECVVSWAGPPGDLGVEVRGGAERGEFPYLGRLRDEPGGGTCCVLSGKAPGPGDVLLEVNGTPVSGLTNRDTLAVIRHFREPIRLKTVKPERRRAWKDDTTPVTQTPREDRELQQSSLTCQRALLHHV